ncbi:MAG: transposase, partial [Kiritimatiellia bacterium]|nr:transposase [Kiritimatiellia bacterium]
QMKVYSGCRTFKPTALMPHFSTGVYNVVLGRSEASLEGYLQGLKGKKNVRLICIDLSTSYRAMIRKHFPNAKIVADRFHVIRIVNHHFLATWRQLDPKGSKNRGLISLMRRHEENLKPEQKERLEAYLAEHPALETIYGFKQRLCRLLRKKCGTKRRCRRWIPRLLSYIHQLKTCGFEQLETLGRTLARIIHEMPQESRETRYGLPQKGFWV